MNQHREGSKVGSVAVGDRLIVAGSLSLVGRLGDGTVICDGQVYSFFTWTSDDNGHTWEMHESRQLSSVAWTGERFIAWSNPETSNGAPSQLLISNDGIDWVTAAVVPATPDGSMPVGTGITTNEGRVVAWTVLHSWALQVPDDVTAAEQLREFLATSDMEGGFGIEGALESIGVDFPLDNSDRDVISSFAGATVPAGVIVAISTDGGATWDTTVIDEPITGIAVISNAYIALTSEFGDRNSGADYSSELLTSTDGISWTPSIKLPEFAYGSTDITATTDSIYVIGEETSNLLSIPTP